MLRSPSYHSSHLRNCGHSITGLTFAATFASIAVESYLSVAAHRRAIGNEICLEHSSWGQFSPLKWFCGCQKPGVAQPWPRLPLSLLQHFALSSARLWKRTFKPQSEIGLETRLCRCFSLEYPLHLLVLISVQWLLPSKLLFHFSLFVRAHLTPLFQRQRLQILAQLTRSLAQGP